MTASQSRPRQPRPMNAGALQPEISSFRLHLAAEAKAPKTITTYAEAVAWFAAAHLLPRTSHPSWEEVQRQDVQEWIASLLDCHSSAYASNQFRALQQFFKWLAAEEDIPDPMAGLRPPHVPEKPVPVFTSSELTRLESACAGKGFAQRRDAAIVAVLRATGIRLAELAGLRYDPGDPRRSDLDLWNREITVTGKGSSPRPTRSAACSLPCAARPQASSTPATGHDGGTAARNEHVAATTSGNASKIT
jgi:site-specific recombinase XerC